MLVAEVPLCSAIVPCYNQPDYLAECLASLCEQNLNNWEAVVVDDHSTVGDVASVVSSLGDRRVRLIRHEQNRGLAASRNTGIQAACADLVVPVDCDDRLHPDYLTETVGTLQREHEVDCVFTDMELFGDHTGVLANSLEAPEVILKRQWIPGAGTTMRKSLWMRVGGYCEDTEFRAGNEDWDFWIGAVARGVRAAHIARPLYCYRKTAASMSAVSLRLHDHVTRDRIYARHREIFDAHSAGRPFRAEGYLISSLANLATGRRHRLRGLVLAIRGMLVCPSDRRLAESAKRMLLPRKPN